MPTGDGRAFCVSENHAMPLLDITQLPLDLGDDFARLMRTYYPLMLARAFGDAGEQIGMEIAFDLANPRVQDVLDELVTQVTAITETTRDEIRALIGRQADEGWSIARLASEIRDLAGTHAKARAEAIARTETATAYSKGQILAWKESGVVAGMQWLATLDDQTSAECRALNGQIAPLGQTFDGGAAHPPRHTNCRCVLQPVLKD